MDVGSADFNINMTGGESAKQATDRLITSLSNLNDKIVASHRSTADQNKMQKEAIRWLRASDTAAEGLLKGVNNLSSGFTRLTRVQKLFNSQSSGTVNAVKSIQSSMDALHGKALVEDKKRNRMLGISAPTKTELNAIHGRALEENKKYNDRLVKSAASAQDKMNALHGKALEMNKKLSTQRAKTTKGTSKYGLALGNLSKKLDENTKAHRGWYQRFIVTGIGFAIVYRVINLVQDSITALTKVFGSGAQKADEYQQALGEVAGMLSTLRKAGTFTEAFNQNIKALAGTMQQITWLAPEFGLSTETIGNGIKELAQFGVVLKEDQIRPFLATLTAIEQIASTTGSSARQIRQEIQAIFNGQRRVTDQFGKFLEKIPGLKEAIYGIDKMALSSQEKWEMILEKFGRDYISAIEFANARIGKQFTMIIERIGTISMSAMQQSGIWQMWVGDLQSIYKALTDINSSEFKDFYEWFYRAWVWTDRLIDSLFNLFDAIGNAYNNIADALAPYKDIILTTVKYWAYIKGAKVLFGQLFSIIAVFQKPVFLAWSSLAALYNVLQSLAALKGLSTITTFFKNVSAKALTLASTLGVVVSGLYVLEKVRLGNKTPTEDALERLNVILDKQKESAAEYLKTHDKLHNSIRTNIENTKNQIADLESGAEKPFSIVDFVDGSTNKAVAFAKEQMSAMVEAMGNMVPELDTSPITDALGEVFDLNTNDIEVKPFEFSSNMGNVKEVLDNIGVETADGMYEAVVMAGKRAYDAMADDTKALADNLSTVWDDLWEGNIRSVEDLFDAMAKSVLDTFTQLMSDMTSAYFNQFLREVMSMNGNQSGSWLTMAANGAMSLFSGGGGSFDNQGSAISAGSGGFGSSLSGFSIGASTLSTNNPFAAGGLITEPVAGIGLTSGESYSFAENGPERVLSNKDSFTTPGVSVNMNIINNSSAQVTSKQSKPKFDGKKMILDVVLEDYNNGGQLYKSLGR